MSKKQYADRDVMELDKLGNYYCRHVSAMTKEGLHEKSDIAAELAHRDAQIEQMQQVVKAARCIRHWHDSGKDGMVVSASHVRALWQALDDLDRAHNA